MNQQAQAKELWEQGWPNTAIADAVGVDEKTIRRWKKKAFAQQAFYARDHQEDTKHGKLHHVFPWVTADTAKITTATFSAKPRVEAIEETDEKLKVELVSPVRLTTKEDIAKHANIDLAKWKIERVWARARGQAWGMTVQCAPKVALDTTEAVEALVDGVIAARRPIPLRIAPSLHLVGDGQTMTKIVIADPHIAKLCWGEGTGETDYDTKIAQQLVLGGVEELLSHSDSAHRTLVFLGDFFHYDTPQGTTTAGTMQDRDSRLQKMLEVGAETAVRAIDRCAQDAELHVVIVPGNHDSVLTWALQRIVQAEFRGRKGVTIDPGYTKRKTHTYGANAFLYDHGDKAKAKLPMYFATQFSDIWGPARYREIHTGHLHHENAQYFGVVDKEGCLMYTHPSMSPADQWHADELYTNSTRAMKSFTYHINGGLIASHTAPAALLLPPAKELLRAA